LQAAHVSSRAIHLFSSADYRCIIVKLTVEEAVVVALVAFTEIWKVPGAVPGLLELPPHPARANATANPLNARASRSLVLRRFCLLRLAASRHRTGTTRRMYLVPFLLSGSATELLDRKVWIVIKVEPVVVIVAGWKVQLVFAG
jgi:hypothetical protein